MAPCAKTYKTAIKSFLIVNLIFVVGGPCISFVVFKFNNRFGKIEQLISSYTEDTQVPANLMYFSAALTSINGVLGILSAFFDLPLLFDSHEGFTFISLGLNLIATIASSLVPTRPSITHYENMFQAETYHLLKHPKFTSVSQGKHMWKNIQEVIGCCGVLGPRDWLFSSLQALPASCCNSKEPTRKKCELLVESTKNWTSSDFIQIKDEIFPLLWQRNCMEGFQDLLARRKFIWTTFPLCLLLLESFFMAYSALLVDFIRHYTDYMSKRKPHGGMDTLLQKLKQQQAELKIITSKTNLDFVLEETKELRRQSKENLE